LRKAYTNKQFVFFLFNGVLAEELDHLFFRVGAISVVLSFALVPSLPSAWKAWFLRPQSYDNEVKIVPKKRKERREEQRRERRERHGGE
jgi:hypothetical protein